jgi:hypothetical protein
MTFPTSPTRGCEPGGLTNSDETAAPQLSRRVVLYATSHRPHRHLNPMLPKGSRGIDRCMTPPAGAGLSLRRNTESNVSMACSRALFMSYLLSYPADKQGVISV